MEKNMEIMISAPQCLVGKGERKKRAQAAKVIRNLKRKRKLRHRLSSRV